MANSFRVFLCFSLCLQTVLCQFGLFMPRNSQNSRPLFGLLDGAKRVQEGITGLFNPRRERPAMTTLYPDYTTTPLIQDPYVNPGIVTFPDSPQYQPSGDNGNVYFGQNPSLNPNYGNQPNPTMGVTFPDQGYNRPIQGNQGDAALYEDQGNQVTDANQGQGNDVNGVIFQDGNGPIQGNDPVNFGVDSSQPPVVVSSTEAPVTTTTTTLAPTTTTAAPTTEAPATTTLPPLTPVSMPKSESRNSFDFASQGIFMETCNAVEGGLGNCVSVFKCPRYMTVLKESQTNPGLVQALRKAHCGFEGSNPKVCCPLSNIPSTPQTIQSQPTPAPTTTTTTTLAPALIVPSTKTAPEDFVLALPEPPYCGVSNASFSRVVGGVDAKLGDFPWEALLGYNSPRTGGTNWQCGGSLITNKHVLTAAHCVHNHETDLYVVRLGELDLSREDDGATPVDVLIKKKIKHEKYDPNAYTNDIAILVLEQEVQFTDLIRPICIPKESELRAKSFEDYNPIIAGWGQTNFRGPSSPHLQVVQLPVVSNEFCAQSYQRYESQVIDERTLCAGYKNGGKDACKGDSGGPLMQPIWSKQTLKTYFYQIGVVSFGKGCAEAGFPGVYSRVTHFVPWIMSTVVGTHSR